MKHDLPSFAVLIDADNVRLDTLSPILEEITRHGRVTVRRIYGDFTTPNLGGWRLMLSEHAIQPIQQYRNTVGKNASDSALIIDAMLDLLHSRRFDGFCLVSSDSDFTRLVTRIREDGLTVFSFGEKKAPKAFVNACDRYIYVENLIEAPPTTNLDDLPPQVDLNGHEDTFRWVAGRRAREADAAPGDEGVVRLAAGEDEGEHGEGAGADARLRGCAANGAGRPTDGVWGRFTNSDRDVSGPGGGGRSRSAAGAANTCREGQGSVPCWSPAARVEEESTMNAPEIFKWILIASPMMLGGCKYGVERHPDRRHRGARRRGRGWSGRPAGPGPGRLRRAPAHDLVSNTSIKR